MLVYFGGYAYTPYYISLCSVFDVKNALVLVML